MPKKLGPISSEFVSSEKSGKYKYSLGRYIASSLAGFLAGVIVTCLIWLLVLDAFFKQ